MYKYTNEQQTNVHQQTKDTYVLQIQYTNVYTNKQQTYVHQQTIDTCIHQQQTNMYFKKKCILQQMIDK